MPSFGQGSVALPELRQDLRLAGRSIDLAGNALWKIYDPVRHRYTAISHKFFAMLDAWQDAQSVDDIIEAAWNRHAEIVSPSDVEDLVGFLLESGLAIQVESDAWRSTYLSAEKYRAARLKRLMHNYLFFRIPLFDPERFLRATLPIVRPLGSRWTFVFIVALALCALYFISREWDQFKDSAAAVVSWSGAANILVAIVFVKVLHELGHGYVALHHGCRVPATGVAFILGAPLLFVDVTDGWKLRSKRAQLAIDSAGIAVDLSISIIALFVWVFLPDGIIRSAAFTLATAGWVTSLLFNLNPFMKFDSYHILADSLSMPNLQSRSMALAQWQLRRTLFGLNRPAPEAVPPEIRSWLVLYGWGTWIYRVILFTAIALAVYHYFFKVLGTILFLVEIGYFIVAPIWSELRQWGNMREEIMRSRRFWVTSSIAGFGLLLLVIPWSSTVSVPAVFEPSEIARVHIAVPARVVAIHARRVDAVESGQALLQLSSDELAQQLKIANLRKRVVELRLSRLAGAPQDRDEATILRQEIQSLDRTVAGISRRIAELDVAAPITGSISSLVQHVAVGRWVTPTEPVAVIDGKLGARIRSLVDAADISRVRTGMRARFIPNDPLQSSLEATVTAVALANVNEIDQLELASVFGGPGPATRSADARAVPVTSQYPLLASVSSGAEQHGGKGVIDQPVLGTLLVHGDAESLLHRFWNRVLQVLIRESGF